MLASLLLIGCATQSGGRPGEASDSADFGDAPDEQQTGYPTGAKEGSFPTRAESGGAHVVNPTQAWLGTPGTSEGGDSDGSQPDADDGLEQMSLDMSGDETFAQLVVRVGSEDPDALMWLNVLVDLDMNGRWEGPSEWVVKNHEVNFKKSDKKAHSVQVPPFSYGAGPPPPAAWMRIALTERTVPPAWDGTGSFERGEIEDYLVELPKGEHPLVLPDCRNPDTHSGAWGFDGAEYVFVRCRLKKMGPGSGQVNFEFERQSGGVTHAALCPGYSAEASAKSKHVHGGPVRLDGTPTLGCFFNKAGRLPSRWKLQMGAGASRSRTTNTGVVVGLTGGSETEFSIERGSCELECRGSSGCYGNKACENGCCVESWAEECAELDAQACGRCCAITGGRRASDCVRQSCAQ